MQISFATQPGSVARPNEDYAVASPTAAVLLDGLTAPSELGTGCVHGTPWYVRQLGTRVLHAASTSTETPLAELVAIAIGDVALAHSQTCDLGHPGTPSSTLIVVRATEDALDYLLLFDSVLLLKGTDGVRALSDDRVHRVAQAEREATRQHRIGTAEHAETVKLLVEEERRHRNKAGGFWVAGAVPEAAEHALAGRVERSGVTAAALLSDGVSCLVDTYALADWADMFNLLETSGPQQMIDQVRDAEDSDPDGKRWPRYKRSDDATAMCCRY